MTEDRIHRRSQARPSPRHTPPSVLPTARGRPPAPACLRAGGGGLSTHPPAPRTLFRTAACRGPSTHPTPPPLSAPDVRGHSRACGAPGGTTPKKGACDQTTRQPGQNLRTNTQTNTNTHTKTNAPTHKIRGYDWKKKESKGQKRVRKEEREKGGGVER